MLIDAIIIILREVLEAAILVSLLLSISTRLGIFTYWFWIALAIGLMGASLYAANLGAISEWWDYVGQEVINASLQYGIYFLLLAIVLKISAIAVKSPWQLEVLMAIAVALAIVREGAEIIIFYAGYLHSEYTLMNGLTSGFIGLMIGISAGAIFYYSVLSLRKSFIISAQIIFLSFVAAGMVAQATQLLIQADWLPTAGPIWNSNWLLPEQSIGGHIAYAVFGYEATPTLLELLIYTCSLMSILLLGLTRIYFTMTPSNQITLRE